MVGLCAANCCSLNFTFITLCSVFNVTAKTRGGPTVTRSTNGHTHTCKPRQRHPHSGYGASLGRSRALCPGQPEKGARNVGEGPRKGRVAQQSEGKALRSASYKRTVLYDIPKTPSTRAPLPEHAQRQQVSPCLNPSASPYWEVA